MSFMMESGAGYATKDGMTRTPQSCADSLGHTLARQQGAYTGKAWGHLMYHIELGWIKLIVLEVKILWISVHFQVGEQMHVTVHRLHWYAAKRSVNGPSNASALQLCTSVIWSANAYSWNLIEESDFCVYLYHAKGQIHCRWIYTTSQEFVSLSQLDVQSVDSEYLMYQKL